MNGKRTEVERTAVSHAKTQYGPFFSAYPTPHYGSVWANKKDATVRINRNTQGAIYRDADIAKLKGVKTMPKVDFGNGTVTVKHDGKKETKSFVFVDKPRS